MGEDSSDPLLVNKILHGNLINQLLSIKVAVIAEGTFKIDAFTIFELGKNQRIVWFFDNLHYARISNVNSSCDHIKVCPIQQLLLLNLPCFADLSVDRLVKVLANLLSELQCDSRMSGKQLLPGFLSD